MKEDPALFVFSALPIDDYNIPNPWDSLLFDRGNVIQILCNHESVYYLTGANYVAFYD
jgi:hypothetical protein